MTPIIQALKKDSIKRAVFLRPGKKILLALEISDLCLQLHHATQRKIHAKPQKNTQKICKNITKVKKK